ncbi:MAG: hypothetical protein KatS3mg103_0625 [Phycisphaerales bacterium]|nr:MAG: hypothetical protein KatS3mg103_0625 [Phycisphaerales bacterium]
MQVRTRTVSHRSIACPCTERRPAGWPVLAGGVACLALAGQALGQAYDLAVSATSGLSGVLSTTVQADGSLVGDWDPDTNPDGTRTKPGLFGSFGPTENLPVPASLGLDLGGDLSSTILGMLRATLDADAGQLAIDRLSLDLLGGQRLALPASVTLRFDSFRTRSPDSTFIGGLPITVPLGELALDELRFEQTEPALGLLTPDGPDRWSLAAAVPGELRGRVDLLGSSFDLPPSPAVLPIVGTLVRTADGLTLTASAEVDRLVEQEPMTPLPELPLDLPTILPPGGSASLLASLTVQRVVLEADLGLGLEASGGPVACPADCDADGTLTLLDFLCFQNAFSAGEASADCDADGQLTLLDFLCFQNAFSAGCP